MWSEPPWELMSQTMALPLNYSAHRSPGRRRFGFAAIILSGVLIGRYWMTGGELGTAVGIRLDTGDVRYYYLGVPIIYHRMPEPQRSQVLAMAAKSSVLKTEWHTCRPIPLRPYRDPVIWSEMYDKAAVFAKQDPDLARMLLEDFVSLWVLLEDTGGSSAATVHFPLLSGDFVKVGNPGSWVLVQGWRQDPEVLAYMASKHYTPPGTQPAAATQRSGSTNQDTH